MAWYNKINPFLKTEEKAPSLDNSMFQNYTIGGTLSNVTSSDYISVYGQVGWVFACGAIRSRTVLRLLVFPSKEHLVCL